MDEGPQIHVCCSSCIKEGSCDYKSVTPSHTGLIKYKEGVLLAHVSQKPWNFRHSCIQESCQESISCHFQAVLSSVVFIMKQALSSWWHTAPSSLKLAFYPWWMIVVFGLIVQQKNSGLKCIDFDWLYLNQPILQAGRGRSLIS